MVFQKQVRPLKSHPVLLRGGIKLAKSSLETRDGFCRQLENYEINLDGDYQSVTGYERFDGHPAPSAATAAGTHNNDEDEIADVLTQREIARALIQPVPGNGPVLGVFNIGAMVYAFRDNNDNTECVMFQSSATGWEEFTTGVTLAPGGKFEFDTMNYENRPTMEIIGVDGVNPAFIFDGTTFTQIPNVGMTVNAPTHVAVNPAEIIMLSYPGGSLQYLGVGEVDFAEAGSGELAVAGEIRGLVNEPGDVLAIICDNKIELLYGRTPLTWQKQILPGKSGATENTIQNAMGSIFINEHALTTLARTQNFGDFEIKGLSSNVSNIIRAYRNRAVSSSYIRDKSQYRVYFNDGTGLTCTLLEGAAIGFTTLNMGQSFNCCFSGEDEKYNEVIYAGGENGFVYQLEIGTSFDGEEIQTSLTPQFSHCKSYNINKTFKKFTLEGQALSSITFYVVPYFEYLTPDYPESPPDTFETIGGGGVFDNARFDEFYWNSAVLYQGDVSIIGRGSNVALFLRTSSNFATPHLVKSITYFFTTQGARK